MILLEMSSEGGYDFLMMGYDFARPMPMGNWFPDRKDTGLLMLLWDMILLGELPVNGTDFPIDGIWISSLL